MNPRLNQHPVVRDFFWLTRYTNPYGTEGVRFGTRLKNLGAREDDHGNFILDIGDSRTVFAAHLDTADFKLTRVRREVNGDIISTDGRSILGADDRAGIAVLLHLIRNKVPGRYAFFVGEENGRVGSDAAATRDADDWSNYDRIICWDRYGTNSIITHQMGVQTASDTFAETLAAMYGAVSTKLPADFPALKLTADDGGTYTDSFSFIDLIPECTNISIGYQAQHSKFENQNARFLAAMAEASVHVAWESLPVDIDFANRNQLSWGFYPAGKNSWKTWENTGRYYSSDDMYTIMDAETPEDLVDLALSGTLTRTDVRVFIDQHPQGASELLYTYLMGDNY